MTPPRRDRLAFFLWTSAALAAGSDQHARAYETSGYCAVNEPTWASGSHSVFELACSPNGFTPAPTPTDAGDYANTTSAMRSAYWMWVREGTSRSSLFVDTSQCLSGAEEGGWWDTTNNNSGGTSEVWYETQAGSDAICEAVLGCTGVQYRCGTKKRFYSADIMINQEANWTIINQSNVSECLSTGMTWGLTMLHEIGHAYGLDHENGAMNVMRQTATGVRPRNCHVGQGFRPFPFPDDMNGLMNEHRGYSTSSPPSNFSGTAFYMTAGAGDLTRSMNVVATSASIYVPWSVMSFYPPAPAQIQFRAVLVPATATPSFSYATNAWTFPAGSLFRALRFLTFSGSGLNSGGFTSFTQFGEPIAASELTAGTTYRVWIQVDPLGSQVETDEGDNVFPTDVQVRR